MALKKMGIGFGIMILKDGKILLGKRHDDPEKARSLLHGEGTWTMPGGKLEFGEQFEDACIRETLEETNLKIKKEDLKLISLTNDIVLTAHFVTVGFLCEKFEGKPKVMEPDEITVWQWFDLHDLPPNVFSPSARIIVNYFAKTIYSGLDVD